jgi:NH3-dependent NAD+ synthetase
MVKHGALTKSHVYEMLRSKNARVRRAAFTLLETSNPSLRRDSGVFIEITRFIWDANPSYDVYREFNERHLNVPYKVHELISARLEQEKQEKRRAAADHLIANARGGFFRRLLSRRSTRSGGSTRREAQTSKCV